MVGCRRDITYTVSPASPAAPRGTSSRPAFQPKIIPQTVSHSAVTTGPAQVSATKFSTKGSLTEAMTTWP